jgi:hypothetical protein
MTTTVVTNAKTHPSIVSLIQSVLTSLGLSGVVIKDQDFKLLIHSFSNGQSVYANLMNLNSGGGSAVDQQVTPQMLSVATSGAQNIDGAQGTATLVAGSTTVTVPAPTDGGLPVPVGTTLYATVQAAGGTTGVISCTRVSNTQFTITSTSGTETSTIRWCLVRP